MCLASNKDTYWFAIVGAGDIPIAMPLCCLTTMFSNRMRLFNILSDRASMVAMWAR